MTKNLRITMLILMALLTNTPVLSQSQLTNNQPVRGDLHVREYLIQSKINEAYKAGKINSTELASFQRDFDGILVKENNLKSRTSGFIHSGKQTILRDLDRFEARLDRHSNKSNTTITVDKNNRLQ